MRLVKLWVIAGSAMVSGSCMGCSDAPVSASRAIQIANAQLTSGEEQPLDLHRYQITVRDRVRTWEVIYSRPGTGGPMITEVDKTSGRIVDSRIYQ
jgi:hypothetical protein